jgi:hypothetical protein
MNADEKYMSEPVGAIKIAVIVGLIGAPLIVICGLTMFRYPEAWAKGNSRIARKDLNQFDSPRQLERTRRLGKLFMTVGAFEFISMIWLIVMLHAMK